MLRRTFFIIANSKNLYIFVVSDDNQTNLFNQDR